MVVVVVIIIISIIMFTSVRSHKQTLTNSQQISFIFFAGSKKKKVPGFVERWIAAFWRCCVDKYKPRELAGTGFLLKDDGWVGPNKTQFYHSVKGGLTKFYVYSVWQC
jgi:hypothetical protein